MKLDDLYLIREKTGKKIVSSSQRIKTKLKDKKIRFLLPNLLTTGCLFFGFLSIISSLSADFKQAAIYILIAGIFDGLDGRIARLTNATSRFGIEYDSLSDLVSFGVAPSLLAYTWFLREFDRIGWIVSFLYVATAALRLSRFNTLSLNPTVDRAYFLGLPSPAAAFSIATLVIALNYFGIEKNNLTPIIFTIVITLSILMVSNIKYYSFKKIDHLRISNFILMVSIVFVFTILAIEPNTSIFILVYTYVLSGPVFSLIRLFSKKKSTTTYTQSIIQDFQQKETNETEGIRKSA